MPVAIIETDRAIPVADGAAVEVAVAIRECGLITARHARSGEAAVAVVERTGHRGFGESRSAGRVDQQKASKNFLHFYVPGLVMAILWASIILRRNASTSFSPVLNK